jgi:hypothetical protein
MPRAVVADQLSGREVAAGPEEIDATLPLIFYLTQQLGWDPRQILTRPQWRVPKRPSGVWPAGYLVDVAVDAEPPLRPLKRVSLYAVTSSESHAWE